MTNAESVDTLRAIPLALRDLAAPRQVLRDAGLPADDLDADGVILYAFEQSIGVVGYGGFEIYGDVALLRSIVVDPLRRRRGVGARIVRLLLGTLAILGVRRAFLLTTDARPYFEGLGFAVVDRKDAPAAILATRQAAKLCPASAVLMAKAVTNA